MKRLHFSFAAGLLAPLAAPPAAAQFFYNQYPADTSRLYSYVEQMPALPGGGGNAALVRAVQRRLVLPPDVAAGRLEGRVFVRLVVGVSGVARQYAIAQSLSPSADAAALAAVRQLPRLLPGRLNGTAVAVPLTLPVLFYGPRHVFAATEVAQAARFAGGPEALERYVRQGLRPPPEVQQRDLRGRTVVRAVVLPSGRIGATEVVASLCGPCDDEALRVVRAMPRWQPALGYDDRPVAVSQTFNLWFEPPPPPAGTPAPVPEAQVFDYADPLPALPTGPATPAALAQALLERLDYPDRSLGGQGQVAFVVEPDGRVTRPVILKSFANDALDEAVLRAALQLPRFVPGRVRGQAVAVRLAVPLVVELR